MRAGDFERAWCISDEVLRARMLSRQTFWSAPRHLQPVWNGASLEGKRVLVRCYHGLGDTIQFVRFAEPLRRLARHVTYWTQPPLVELVATVPGIDRALPLHDGAPEHDYDVDIESMELAHALRVQLADLPGRVPYLFPSPPHPSPRTEGSPLRVGLVWRAGSWDTQRSIPTALIRRLTALPGVRFHSLQRGLIRREANGVKAADIACDDVTETARRAMNLDLIITVDTMMAHLAGALGIRTWTLLHAECDWRWMETRMDSPWYPSMRLFRQCRLGDWEGVMDEVVEELSLARDGHDRR
jgi:hypothetical protein